MPPATEAKRHYTSAIQRLAALPEVFRGSDLTVLFSWKSAIASTYLAQWRKAGLVRSLGGRSDIHLNLIRNPQVPTEVALRMAYPRAVKLGVDVLRQAGWTTQIPSTVDVAIPRTSQIHAVAGFRLSPRPERWYAQVAPGVVPVSQGLNQLTPAWSLADLLARARDARVADAWLPDPEDLDWPAILADKALPKALTAFKLGAAESLDYERLYNEWVASISRS